MIPRSGGFRRKHRRLSTYIGIDITQDPNNAPSAQVVSTQTAPLSNYPNPFNPEPWIPYQLAKRAKVTLTIYDVRGTVVWWLVLGYKLDREN